jgi:predicted Holliday junction resolvase-like endonuclease
MLAVEQLHANALLVVLLSAALAIVSLRAAAYFCQRALVARDRDIIATLRRTSSRSERTPNSEHTRNESSL